MLDLTPIFSVYARRRRHRLAGQNAWQEQQRQLQRLLARAANTRFGRDHAFRSIKNVADYQRAVPLRRYEDFWSRYWQRDFPVLSDNSWPGKIPFFAETSGTTSGTSKYIPVTRDMNRANARAALDLLVHHLAHRSNSHVLAGQSFMLGSSTTLKPRGSGVYSGDLSGIAFGRTPWWFAGRRFPPRDVAALGDWEKKIETIVSLVPEADIRVLGGTPSWLLLLFERQQAQARQSLAALYPRLELLVHGGVNFKPYRARFENLLPQAELREAYAASEGFIALQDESPELGLRLMADNGLFFEFVPVRELNSANPLRATLADVEPGEDYAIALSSCAGCWAYLVGDTVRFVSRDPPRILVTGRTSYFMSAFGEHLSGEEIEDAVAGAAVAIANSVTDFSMGAIFASTSGGKGGHLYIVEFERAPKGDELQRFSAVLDRMLLIRNDDYRHYRDGDILIRPPGTIAVPPGSFAAWMKSRGRLGGQNKVPRVINDQKLFAELREFIAPSSRP